MDEYEQADKAGQVHLSIQAGVHSRPQLMNEELFPQAPDGVLDVRETRRRTYIDAPTHTWKCSHAHMEMLSLLALASPASMRPVHVSGENLLGVPYLLLFDEAGGFGQDARHVAVHVHHFSQSRKRMAATHSAGGQPTTGQVQAHANGGTRSRPLPEVASLLKKQIQCPSRKGGRG